MKRLSLLEIEGVEAGRPSLNAVRVGEEEIPEDSLCFTLQSAAVGNLELEVCVRAATCLPLRIMCMPVNAVPLID